MRYNQFTKDIDNKIVFLFRGGLIPSLIAKHMGKHHTTIVRVLKRNMTENEYQQIKNKNKQMKREGKTMVNVNEIIENNRIILSNIAEKIRENKVNELSNEDITYARILFQNGFITEKGEVTEEGKNALYQ